jgi:hypothetical protein
MSTATYKRPDGTDLTVEYDPAAPCRVCGLPVCEASMSGTDVCQWCDDGINRDGTPWGEQDMAKILSRFEGPVFAWKRLADGQIVQQANRSKESCFEAAGFGAVRVDEPIKGYLCVRVQWRGGVLVEMDQ